MQTPFDLYEHFQKNNNLIAVNMVFPWSPGHMISELDNLLRMVRLGEIPSNVICFVPVMEHSITQTIADIYAPVMLPRIVYVPNNTAYMWCREIARASPEMIIDVGFGHSRYALKTMEEHRLMMFLGCLDYVITNRAVIRDMVSFVRRRSQSLDYFPLAEVPEMGDDLRQFLGGRCDKIALSHARHALANSGVPSGPEQFYESLGYLRDLGYTMVFVSRDPYVQEFSRFGVLNYAQSTIASFRNDIILFKAAKMAIISGSGICALAQAMNLPFVYANYWNWPFPPSSQACIWLPANISRKETGKLLKFSEGLDMFFTRAEAWELERQPNGCYGNPWTFSGGSLENYELHVPTSGDMLEAVKECVSLSAQWRPRSDLQNRYSALCPESMLPFQEGRISEHFVARFQDLL